MPPTGVLGDLAIARHPSLTPAPKHALSEDDRRFRSAFEAGTFLAAEFNHRAHVRLAYTYLVEADDEAAFANMRAALLAFLKRNGVPMAKYHETMTRAWILAVRHFMEISGPSASADAFIDANPRLLDAKIMLTHYSAGLLFSDEARGRFVEPDVDAIPRHGGPREGILRAIGNTSIVRLAKVAPAGGAEIVAKLEWENPTGSMKDRMALAVLSRAEADGRLKPGDTVIEYTGGSTGTSLALVCAAKGYPIHIVTSDAFSREKLDHMAALGARLTLVPSEGGKTTKKLILDMVEVARKLSLEPNTFWTDQLNNQDSIAGYHALGEEIWTQTEGRVDAFVHCVGTGASSRGVAVALKRHDPRVRIVAVEPAESSVLQGGAPGPHKIEGVGVGFTPPLWDSAVVDEIIAVSTEEAKEMTRRLAREEALFAGTSSGANVVAAIRVASALGPSARVVTLMADSGLKYLSTDVYKR
jgi:cysteine synthase A